MPLLPMPQAVLFPGSRLPLELIEPRHRALIQAVVEGHGALAVARLVDPQMQSQDNPPVCPIAGVGTIVEHGEQSGGRYRIVVLGRARVHLRELSFVAPHRRARATLLPCSTGSVPERELMALHGAATSFAALLQRQEKTFRLRLPADGSPSAVVDACADQLVIDAKQRQAVLEALDVRDRVRLVTGLLTVQKVTLAPEPDHSN
jgi:Lon protease-like protein